MERKCHICGSVTHWTIAHQPFYDDPSKLRQAYLRGWQSERLGTRFPMEVTELERRRFELGAKEAREMRRAA